MLKRFNKEKIFYILMTTIITLEIFLVSNVSTPIGGKMVFNISILYHLGIFFAFTFFLSLSLNKKKIDNKTIAAIILISLAYATSDEFHQLFVPGRFASLKDVITDLIGSLLAVMTVKILERLKKI
jgi:VanZ family protein